MDNFYQKRLNDWIFRILEYSRAKIRYNKHHISSMTVIVFFAILFFYNSLLHEGTLMYVDMTWPSSLERTFEMFSTTWFPYGSFPNIENVQRIVWTYPLLILSLSLNLSVSTYLLLLFAGTFILAGVSMYILVYSMLLERESKFPVKKSFIATIAGLLYMFNPWSLGHMWTYFQYPNYALLPLTTFFLIKTIKDPSFKNVLFTALVTTFASTHPNGVIWIWFLILTYLMFHVIIDYAIHKIATLKKVFAILVGIIFLYVLFNAYWLSPYIYSSILSSEGMAPNYLFTPTMLDHLSRNNNVINTLRFLGGAGFPVEHHFDNLIWLALSFSLPIFSFLSILFYKWHQNKIFLMISCITIFLAMGTVAPFPQIYRWLAFDSPVSNYIGWVFRAPDRWLSITSLCYSVMCAFTSVGIIKKAEKLRSRTVKLALITVLMVLVISTSLSFYPLAEKYANSVFSPVTIPPDYQQVNSWLREQKGEGRAFWLPPYPAGGYFPFWAPSRRIGPYSIFSCEFPSIAGIRSPPTTIALETWVDRDIIAANRTNVFGRLVTPLASKFILVDTSVETSSMASGFLESNNDIHLVFKANNLSVYETDYSSSPIFIPKTTIVVIDGGLEKYNTLNTLLPNDLSPQNVAIVFYDQMFPDIFQYPQEGAPSFITSWGNNSLTKMMLVVGNNEITFFQPSVGFSSTDEVSWTPASIYDFHNAIRRLDIEIRPLYDVTFCTNHAHAELSIPVRLSKGGEYQFYMNVLLNQFGSSIEVNVDGVSIGKVDTRSQVNNFVWENIGTIDLSQGEHTVTLENINGFNAVNLFAFVPSGRVRGYIQETYKLFENRQAIYLLEGESDFYHNNSEVSDRYGNEASNAKVLTLRNDGEAWTTIEILRGGTYTLAFRCAARDVVLVNIGQASFEIFPDEQKLSWHYIRNIALDIGTYNLSIASNAVDVDLVTLYSGNEKAFSYLSEEKLKAQIVSYEMIEQTKYVVDVNATTPFVLAIAEAYNPLWVAHINNGGEISTSFPLYSVINGFSINRTGQLQITIEYEPQKYFRYGSAITAISLSGSIGYLLLKTINQLFRKSRSNTNEDKRVSVTTKKTKLKTGRHEAV